VAISETTAGLNRHIGNIKSTAAERPLRGSAGDFPCCSSEDVAMTIDQSLTSFAPDRGEASSRFEWLPTEEIGGTFSGGPDDHADTVPQPLIPPSASPTWPRVYPGL
jgi:hypothetical protein